MFIMNLKSSVAARTRFVVIDQSFYSFWESKVTKRWFRLDPFAVS